MIHHTWNDEILKKCQFPKNLKLADITPVFKKENKNLAKNYRPVSVFPTLSKAFEKTMQKHVLYNGKLIWNYENRIRKCITSKNIKISKYRMKIP